MICEQRQHVTSQPSAGESLVHSDDFLIRAICAPTNVTVGEAAQQKVSRDQRLVTSIATMLDNVGDNTKSAGLSLHVQGRQPVTMAGGERDAAPAGGGFVTSVLGRFRTSCPPAL